MSPRADALAGKAEAMKCAIAREEILEAEGHFPGRRDESCLTRRARELERRIAAIWTRAAAR
jgi:hypothetical protein